MTEDAALTIAQPRNTALMPAMGIEQAVARHQAMGEFVKRILKRDVDFGTIPGTNKPTLLKPGAEKLTTFFGLSTRFTIVEKTEDWTGDVHGGESFFYYHYRCQLWRGDLLVAEGDGSCNSMESKYRWRWVGEDELQPGVDPAGLKRRAGSIIEFKFAVEKSETSGKYGKPADYWHQFKDAVAAGTARSTDKKTRAGKEYPAWEIDTTVFRALNEDIASQVNTIQKMAQKRALVAAVLIGVNASDYFTQDIEDYVESSFAPVSDTSGSVEDGSNDTLRPANPKKVKMEPAPKQRNGGALADNPMTAFWTAVNANEGVSQEQGKVLLGRANGDPTKALELLNGGNDSATDDDRPRSPADLRLWLHGKCGGDDRTPATEKQIPFVARKFEEAFAPDGDATDKYHDCLEWLSGKRSAKGLTLVWARAILDWLLDPAGPDDSGDTPLHQCTADEARRVFRQVQADRGQQDMSAEEKIPF